MSFSQFRIFDAVPFVYTNPEQKSLSLPEIEVKRKRGERKEEKRGKRRGRGGEGGEKIFWGKYSLR
jgi:hypothetical protein